jgi:hypothetical protein
MSNSNHAMLSDSTKTLVDLRGESSFSVGGVKNLRFLFPAKKDVDVRWDVVWALWFVFFPPFFSVPSCKGTLL